jgi:hypothetical protein
MAVCVCMLQHALSSPHSFAHELALQLRCMYYIYSFGNLSCLFGFSIARQGIDVAFEPAGYYIASSMLERLEVQNL